MSIATLGIAVVYLLVVVAGAVGALLVLIWLFGETSEVTARTGYEATKSSRGTNRFGAERSTPSSSVERERSEEAA